MTAVAATAQPCTCGCGAHLEATEYGPVCTCQCQEDQKPDTIAQQIYALRAQREAIDHRIGELTTTQGQAA